MQNFPFVNSDDKRLEKWQLPDVCEKLHTESLIQISLFGVRRPPLDNDLSDLLCMSRLETPEPSPMVRAACDQERVFSKKDGRGYFLNQSSFWEIMLSEDF